MYLFVLLTTFWLAYKLHYPTAYGVVLEVGYSSDSSENPQLLAAPDTLVEPVLLTLDYCGEAVFP